MLSDAVISVAELEQNLLIVAIFIARRAPFCVESMHS